jgi:hypothetical protein
MSIAELARMGVFKELFEDLREDCIRGWSSTDLFDVSLREQHYQDLQAINRLEEKIQSILDNELLRRD